MENAAARTLWWGTGLLVVGVALSVFGPDAAISLAQGQAGSPQAVADLIVIGTRLIQNLVLPLGSALIAASVVIRYVDWRSTSTNADSQPERARVE